MCGRTLEIALLDDVGGRRRALQQAVKLRQLAALALPAHPASFRWIPQPRAMKKEERRRRTVSVFVVERADACRGTLKQRVVVGHVLIWRVGKVGEQRKGQVAVAVAQQVKLEFLQQRVDVVCAGEQGWDNDHRAAFGGDTILKVQPGQGAAVEWCA